MLVRVDQIPDRTRTGRGLGVDRSWTARGPVVDYVWTCRGLRVDWGGLVADPEMLHPYILQKNHL